MEWYLYSLFIRTVSYLSCILYLNAFLFLFDYQYLHRWRECRNCRQEYDKDLAYQLAIIFLKFVEREFPSHEEIHLEALHRKLDAALTSSSFWDNEQDSTNMAKNLANCILMKAKQVKRSGKATLPHRLTRMEAATYNTLGRIAIALEDDPKSALRHFENFRDKCKAEKNGSGIGMAKENIAMAKSMICEMGRGAVMLE